MKLKQDRFYIGKNIDKLDFINFEDVEDFDDKLDRFLNSLDSELTTWQDNKKEGNRVYIPHKIKGYACIKNGEIIGINYWLVYNKSDLRYYISKLLLYHEIEGAAVVKKEYQEKGISSTLIKLKTEYAIKQGYKRIIGGFNVANMGADGLSRGLNGRTIVKKTKDTIFWYAYLSENIKNQSPRHTESIAVFRIKLGLNILNLGSRFHRLVSIDKHP